MSWISRRSFFGLLLGLSALLSLPRRLWALVRRDLPDATLRAVGRTVLPGELGTRGQDRIAAGFQEWLNGFRPESQMPAGWGSAEIPHGPPDPTERWSEQLERLDQAALRVRGIPFAELEPETRLGLLREEIEEETLPLRSPAQAEHVAVGLLSYFYRSPEAANLCYRAAIHAESCRELSTAGRKPDPLQGGR